MKKQEVLMELTEEQYQRLMFSAQVLKVMDAAGDSGENLSVIMGDISRHLSEMILDVLEEVSN